MLTITTTNNLDGYEVVEYLGIVTGEAVSGINMFRDIGAGLRNVFGGRSAGYEDEMAQAREEVLREMSQRAEKLGANAVIGANVGYDAQRVRRALRGIRRRDGPSSRGGPARDVAARREARRQRCHRRERGIRELCRDDHDHRVRHRGPRASNGVIGRLTLPGISDPCRKIGPFRKQNPDKQKPSPSLSPIGRMVRVFTTGGGAGRFRLGEPARGAS